MKKIIISIISICLLLGMVVIYLLRYQSVHNILGEDFTGNFVLHTVWAESMIPTTQPPIQGTQEEMEEYMRRADFNERYASRHDRHYQAGGDAGYIISDEQAENLLDLLLNIQVRSYSLSAHPIAFNTRFFHGSFQEEFDLEMIIRYHIFDLNFQQVITISILGKDIMTIEIGEVTEDAFSANRRAIGFNPTIFSIHDDDRHLVFEMLRVLGSNASEELGFEMEYEYLKK